VHPVPSDEQPATKSTDYYGDKKTGKREVRLAAAQQLGMLGDSAGQPEVLEVFAKNLTAGMDSKGRERVTVLTALAIGEIGTESLTRFLPQLLKDQSEFVRIAAAKAVLQCAMKNES
jgi:HEAT repeat protein